MIEYEEVGDENGALRMNISNVGGQKEMTTGSITGLRPLTHYDIRVAAVNSAGIGPFTSTNASTLGIITLYTFQSYNVNCWSFLQPYILMTQGMISLSQMKGKMRGAVLVE